MGDGSTRAIQDLRPGDEVIAVNTWAETRPTVVTAIHDNGSRPCFTYRFAYFCRGVRDESQDVSLTCTPDHKVLFDCNGYELQDPEPFERPHHGHCTRR
jgi:hypothetical protein